MSKIDEFLAEEDRMLNKIDELEKRIEQLEKKQEEPKAYTCKHTNIEWKEREFSAAGEIVGQCEECHCYFEKETKQDIGGGER